MATDGTITIQTKLVTNKFDKQMLDLEKKIKSEEEKSEIKLKAKLQAEGELKRHLKDIEEVEKGYERTSKQVEYLQGLMSKQKAGVSLTPQQFTDLSSYKQVSQENDKIGAQLDKMYNKWDSLNAKVDKTSLAYKEISSRVQDYKTKLESIKLQKHQAEVEQIEKGFGNVGKKVQSTIGNIARMALGLVSVASAYSLVKRASSTLGQYDKQYATNLEYINYLLSQALAPALKFLVNLASTLLSYLNYILNAWFGITLFSKNSAKNFMSAKNSTGGISKNTGKIKKDLQTTPFDEMNILSDTSSDTGTTGVGGTTGGGAVMPSIDPSMLQGEVPDWLKWIVDNKDVILAIISGVAFGLLAWQLGLEGIKAVGIGVLIAGVVYTIESLLEYLQDPSWENFGKIIQGVGVIILGLGLLIQNVPLIVAGAIVLIVGTIIKYWDQIKETIQGGIDWLTSQSDWIHAMFGDTIGAIYDNIVDILQQVFNIFDSVFSMIKGVFDGFIMFITGVFTGNWKQAWEGIKNIFTSIWEGIKGVFISVFNIIKDLVVSVARATGDVIGKVFRTVVNAVLNVIESVLNTPINAIDHLLDIVNSVPGIHIPVIPTFKLPRLKSGGILNMPGRGVPVGGGTAIGGEAGREGVIPLTDSQAMETLGEAIGRYITINANITNSMNGRVISRQLQQIKNDREFAYNG